MTNVSGAPIMDDMSSNHKPTTDPTAVQAAQGATGQDAVAPVPPSECICGTPMEDDEPAFCEYHRANGGGPLNVVAPVRRHPVTGFECTCPRGPCPTLDRHIDERMYLRDQKYGDPWARPSVDLAEQRHVESLAVSLWDGAQRDTTFENSYSDDRIAELAVNRARMIVNQNRKVKL